MNKARQKSSNKPVMEQLCIRDLASGGDGVGHLPTGDAVFVPLTVTGDVVCAEVQKDDRNVYRGRLIEIVTPSPRRIDPPCRHFGACGGCALQHVEESLYRAFKKDVVIQALARQTVSLDATGEVETIFLPAQNRRRANFAARIVKGRALIGFHERKSANIRDVPDCLLLDPDVARIMERLRPYLPHLVEEGKKIDVLIQCVEGDCEIGFTGKLGRAQQSSYDYQQTLVDMAHDLNVARLSRRDRDYDPYETLLQIRPFHKRFGDLSVELGPGAFLQPSAQGEAALVSLVTRNIAAQERIADLFCGHGTFTGPLLGKHQVYAADNAPDAISALRRAGVRAEFRNLFTDPLDGGELAGFDLVILDPPRAGAQAQVRHLSASVVPKIIYVSCSAQSFARDARILEEGGYCLKSLAVVDQFIWSAHTETVAVFEK